jgi:hypothetical protein
MDGQLIHRFGVGSLNNVEIFHRHGENAQEKKCFDSLAIQGYLLEIRLSFC